MRIKKAITKPSKQRKMLYNAPDQKRYKLFAAPLSQKLTASHNVKTISVRTGDTIRVMRGDRKGFEGKVSKLDKKKYRLIIEGLNREKVDGTSVPIFVHPSKVMLTNLKLDDKWRKKILERRKKPKIKDQAKILSNKVINEKKKVTEKKSKIKSDNKIKSKTVRKKNITKGKVNLKNKVKKKKRGEN